MKRSGKVNLFIFLGIIVSVFALWYLNADVTEQSLIQLEPREISQTNQVYQYKIFYELPEEIIETIKGSSYREDSPVSLEELAYIQLMYWSFDNIPQQGEIIVNQILAEEVAEIFKEIYEAKFPIDKMRLIDRYQADDYLSMADNNTAAFCVRDSWGSNKLSKHSYGLAVDINPVQNPYIKDNTVIPEEGRDFQRRSRISKGMIIPGDVVYTAFKKRGWTWGGEWKTLKDYQHFEKVIPN